MRKARLSNTEQVSKEWHQWDNVVDLPNPTPDSDDGPVVQGRRTRGGLGRRTQSFRLSTTVQLHTQLPRSAPCKYVLSVGIVAGIGFFFFLAQTGCAF